MKKFTLSFIVITTTLIYAFYQNIPGKEKVAVAVPDIMQTQSPVEETPLEMPAILPPAPKPKPVITVKTPVKIPVAVTPPKPKGQYTDGTYTGGGADAYYGTVQVAATITSGRLSSVRFLQYPNDRNNSIRINSRAMPVLESEAIQAQSANVHIVSGATDTSIAFRQSLEDALTQAKS